MVTLTKQCISCQRGLHGRSDKKFCNDFCRNSYNNRLNSDGNKYVRNINHCLRKNRRILESILPAASAIAQCTQQCLHSKGFAFSYFTHTQTNKKGNTYRFCYEYGYWVRDGKVVIVRKNQARFEKAF